MRFVIAHLYGAYHATKLKGVAGLENADSDAAEFLSYTIPGVVWGDVAHLYDERFVEYVNKAGAR